MSGPTFTLPSSTFGAVGIPSSAQDSQEDRFYGKDVWFSVDMPGAIDGEANWLVTPAGDWTVVTGREALRQSLLRRLITSPGEWKTKPNYGCGARDYVKARNTAGNREELAAKIRSQFMIDPRVHSVDLVIVHPLDDGSEGLKVSILVTPTGRLRGDKPLAVNMEIT